MGSIKGKFIKGQVAHLVYREYRGTQVVQSMPEVQKNSQSEGTKKAAKLFGKSSKLAAAIRTCLHHICHRFYDGTMNYRLNGEVLNCLKAARQPETEQFNFHADSFRSLAGFEFNTKSTVRSTFYVQPQVTLLANTLTVTIPEISIPSQIKWPIDRPKCCKLVITMGLIDLKSGSYTNGQSQVMDIPYTYQPSTVASQSFEFNVSPGCLCLMGISLQIMEQTFLGEDNINNELYNPAAILSAQLVPGTFDKELQPRFHNFDKEGYSF